MAHKAVTGRGGSVEAMFSGVRFRSTLEARWALFYDTLGWEWDYEPAQYPVCDGHGYVPDLYVVGYGWVEVKGEAFLTASSISKIACGAAGPRPLPGRAAPYTPPGTVLVMGDIPEPKSGRRPMHTIVMDIGDHRAAAYPCVLEAGGIPSLASDTPLHTFDASGAMAKRAPSKAVREAICNPGYTTGHVPSDVARAYARAKSLKVVGPYGKTDPITTPGRWGGRAL